MAMDKQTQEQVTLLNLFMFDDITSVISLYGAGYLAVLGPAQDFGPGDTCCGEQLYPRKELLAGSLCACFF